MCEGRISCGISYQPQAPRTSPESSVITTHPRSAAPPRCVRSRISTWSSAGRYVLMPCSWNCMQRTLSEVRPTVGWTLPCSHGPYPPRCQARGRLGNCRRFLRYGLQTKPMTRFVAYKQGVADPETTPGRMPSDTNGHWRGFGGVTNGLPELGFEVTPTY
jgi:hypothetical protein